MCRDERHVDGITRGEDVPQQVFCSKIQHLSWQNARPSPSVSSYHLDGGQGLSPRRVSAADPYD